MNWELVGNPVNWIKIGLMSATFILAIIFLVQLVTATGDVPSISTTGE